MFWFELQPSVGGTSYSNVAGRKFSIVGDYKAAAVCLFDSVCVLYMLYDPHSISANVLDGDCGNNTRETDASQNIRKSEHVCHDVVDYYHWFGSQGARGSR
mmetsp:Transcript_23848/g.35511  ORF Transcript_23848/g.35511 Transcript_23848/m.35511 type:complete len:101 (+) Transcript_23848:1008-1310(+)